MEIDPGWGAWGALAYLFSNPGIRAFLSDPEVVNHRHHGPGDGQRNIDSVVGAWCRRNSLPYFVHVPSLAQHIGETSTISCNGSSASATVTAATITLSEEKVVTGLTKPVPSNTCGIEDFTITTEVSAIVRPLSALSAVDIKVGGVKRVEIDDKTRDPITGKITIKFLKASSMTPKNKPDGDTQLQATLDHKVCHEIPVIAPYAVVPVSTPETMVDGENEVADKCSSPAYFGALGENQVYLCTVYGVDQNIRVNDQFGQPLNAIYDGAPVFENVSGWKPINQNISGGHYSDPVGSIVARPPPPSGSPKLLKTNSVAIDWPNADPIPAVNFNDTQRIGVQIAGITLNTGIKNRQLSVVPITSTTTAKVTINWK